MRKDNRRRFQAKGARKSSTERALDEARERYRSLFQHNPHAVYSFDLDGRFLSANPACERLTGYTEAELVRLQFQQLIVPEKMAQTAAAFERAAAGEPQRYESTHLHKDGSRVDIAVTNMPIFVGGTVVGVYGVAEDIGERRCAQEALRRSEERYRLATRATQEVLWDSDLQTGRTVWHGAVQSMFGIADQTFEHAGDWWESRLHPADRTPVLESTARLFGSDDEMWSMEYRFRRQDGSFMDVFARGHVVRDRTGHPLRFVGSMMDISAQKRSEAELERLAFIDPLTGLANRSRLFVQLDQALAEAHRTNRAVAVFFLDLDRFKLINDGMGHAAGDSLLAQFGSRLSGVLRAEDVSSRLAGDEFVVVCKDTDEEDARNIADRIASAVQDPFVIEGSEIFVSVSVGIVLSEPGDTAASLLRRSDAAMYHSKADEKGAAILFDEKMQHKALEVINIESQFSRAIERGELELHYQPILDLSDFRPIGLEALVRWNRPGRGLVTAGEFIPVAEKSGLILRIGAWVIREAIHQAQAWRQHLPGAADLAIGVNISARQLRDPAVFEQVRAAIAGAGIQPDAVVLEITESELVGHLDGSLQVLERLRKLGVGIAIDDFGTGYSALSYLSRIPANVVKIDRSFISPLGRGGAGRERALVAAIVSMAAALDLVVVAEGVETASQAVEVAGLNAGLGQGYHWCRPLPAEPMEAWLRSQYARVAAEAQAGHCVRFASGLVPGRE